ATLAPLGTISATITYLQTTTTFAGTGTTGATNDVSTGNNTATVIVTGSAADMAASFTGFPPSAPVGTTVTGVANFVNVSTTGTAVSPTVTLKLTPGLGAGNVTVVSSTLGTGVYNNTTGVVTFPIAPPATLAPLGTISATITYLQTTTTFAGTGTTGATNDVSTANNTATVIVTGSAADMAASFTGFPPSAPVGTTVTGVANFVNVSTTGTAVSPTVTLKVTPGLAAITVTSATLGAGTYNTTTGVVTFANAVPGTLAPQGSISAVITYLQGTTSFAGTATASATNDTNPANNTATVTVTGSAADMSATFAGFPPTVPVGTTATGTVNFVNISTTGTAVSPTVTLKLTPGLGGNVTVTSATLGAGNYNNATGVVTFPIAPPATLAPLGTITATITYLQGSSTFGGTGTTGAVNDVNTANNTATLVVGGALTPDVGTTLTLQPSAPGSSVASGTVTFFNIGATTANNVTRTVALGNATFVSVTGGVTSTGNVTATFPVVSLPVGTSASFTFTYAMPSAGSANGTSTIATSSVDINQANNKAAGITIVSGTGVDMSVTLSINPALLVQGTNTVIVTVTNVGTLPSGGTVTVGLPPGATTPAGSTAVFVLTSTLTPGQTVSFTTSYQLTPLDSATKTFTASVDAPNDTNLTNNFGTLVAEVGARVRGRAWIDSDRLGANFRTFQAGEPLLPNLLVRLTNSSSVVVGTAFTAIDGTYKIEGVPAGTGYKLEFLSCTDKADTATCTVIGTTPVNQGPVTEFGNNNSAATTSFVQSVSGTTVGQSITGISLYAGDNTVDQNLPVDPSGVVYDSTTRLPLNGATVALFGPYGPGGSQALVPPALLVGGINQCISGVNCSVVPGGYQFFLQGPGLVNGTYTLQITPPAGYSASAITPSVFPENPVGPGVPFLAQPQGTAPAAGASTRYFVMFNYVFGAPRDVLNNHIPLDPGNAISGALLVSKTGSKTVAELADSVQYTVRIRNTTALPIAGVKLNDLLPAGFRYILGTSRLGSVTLANPAGGVGRDLTFDIGTIAGNATVDLTYFVRLGVGSQQGDGINRATVVAPIRSNTAMFKVNVQGGVFSNEGCITGKVYVDCDGNAVQNNNGGNREVGIPGVRLVMLDGTFFITDPEGKYSVCGVKSQTHVIKVDRTTLPKGARLVPSSNRNAGVGDSLFVDLKGGELGRADFIEGSCSPEVMEEVRARRAQNADGPQVERASPLKIENRAGEPPVQILPSLRQQDLLPTAPRTVR
ncbi:MAG: DUF11 domain-containing protein, partial [Comamonadaceae bacterium]